MYLCRGGVLFLFLLFSQQAFGILGFCKGPFQRLAGKSSPSNTSLKTKLSVTQLEDRANPVTGYVNNQPGELPSHAVLSAIDVETGQPIPGTHYIVTDPATGQVLIDVRTELGDPTVTHLDFTNPSDYTQRNYYTETRYRDETRYYDQEVERSYTDYSVEPPEIVTYTTTESVPYTASVPYTYETYQDTNYYQDNYNVYVDAPGYNPRPTENVPHYLTVEPPTFYFSSALSKKRLPDLGPMIGHIGQGESVFAVSGAPDNPAFVKVYDTQTGAEVAAGNPFPGFKGGASVAVGDVNGDGVQDIIVGAGPGGGPHVKWFDGATMQEKQGFFAYEESFRGGVTSVGAADFNGDGKAEIVVGAGVGGGPRYRVLDLSEGNPRTVQDDFAYETSFRGGVKVGVGDLNGDGVPDLALGSGPGGGPRVRTIDGSTWKGMDDFFAYNSAFRGGVNVDIGNTWDGTPRIITGAGRGGGPDVRVFEAQGQYGSPPRLKYNFFAGDGTERGGVSVGYATPSLILTVPESGGYPRLMGFDLETGSKDYDFNLFEDPSLFDFTSGFSVSGSRNSNYYFLQ